VDKTSPENGGLQNRSSGYAVGTVGYKKKPGQPRMTSSDEIRRTWTLPGKKPKNRWQTEQNGVNAQCIHQDVG